MPKLSKKKPHRAQGAWKKDVLRLTILLRLRCAPSVPYSVIADILVATKTRIVGHLLRLLGPDSWPVVGDIPEVIPVEDHLCTASLDVGEKERIWVEKNQKWFTGYLQEVCEKAEREDSVHWVKIRDLDNESAQVRIGEVWRAWVRYEGDGTVGSERQRMWRVRGDWRAGSQEDLGHEGIVLQSYVVKQTADLVETETPRRGVVSGDEYSKGRELFFEQMIDGIVADDHHVSKPKKRAVVCKVVGGPRMETIDDKEEEDKETIWRAPKIQYPDTYGPSLEEAYAALLLELKQINSTINDRNWDLSVLNNHCLIPGIAGQDQNAPTSLPDLGQFSDFDSTITSDFEERFKTPEPIPETPVDVWHGYVGDDETTGPSAVMIEAMEQALEQYKKSSHRTKWLKMSG